MKILLAAFALLAGFAFPARADQEVKQVEIEARIAEVNTNDARDIGVDYNFQQNHEIHHDAPNIDVTRNVDGKVLAPSTASQASGFGDTIGVKKIPAVSRTTPLTPAHPPVALKTTPKVSPNGNVVMDVSPEITDLAIADPPAVETAVQIPDSGTLVLGGLKTTESGKKKEGVPVLSNIPLLGRLFARDDKTQEKKDLMVFVTPTVIHPAQETE
jgi:type II secretory pathway component GspD/PulD (secretin)